MTTEIQKTDVRRGHTSASSALPDSLCPGRHLAQIGCEDVKSPWSESGSKIHAALAENPREGINIGTIKSLTLDEREIFDACREIEKKKVLEFFGPVEERSPKGANGELRMKVIREQRFWGKMFLADVTLEHSAQADVIYRCGLKALICEYKTLAGDVPESSRNLQLRDQCVLTRGNLAPLEEIGTVVIQPFVTHSPEICLYTKEDIDRAEREMWARVSQSNDPNSPRVPGDIQCQYCLAKSKCIEYQRWAGSMVPQMLSVLDVPISEWTADQRAMFLDRAPAAQKWLDECKAAIEAGLANDPSFVPGWTLVPGNERETITDLKTLFERFVSLGGNQEQFVSAVSMTKKNLREAVNGLTGARGKALDTAIATLTEGIVEVKQNKPSLKKVKE